jgi:hypothetical protein
MCSVRNHSGTISIGSSGPLCGHSGEFSLMPPVPSAPNLAPATIRRTGSKSQRRGHSLAGQSRATLRVADAIVRQRNRRPEIDHIEARLRSDSERQAAARGNAYASGNSIEGEYIYPGALPSSRQRPGQGVNRPAFRPMRMTLESESAFAAATNAGGAPRRSSMIRQPSRCWPPLRAAAARRSSTSSRSQPTSWFQLATSRELLSLNTMWPLHGKRRTAQASRASHRADACMLLRARKHRPCRLVRHPDRCPRRSRS